ncbi:MAG: hypothetical protein AAF843_07750 [Bacteroidota bacterium]
MGRIIKILAGTTLIVLIALTVIKFSWAENHTALYKIFKSEVQGYYFHKWFGLIPDNVRNRFSTEVLEEANESQVINYSDNSSPTYNNIIVLKEKDDESILKSYRLSASINQKSSVSLSTYLPRQINLSVFNKYLDSHQIMSRPKIMEKYCFFLSVVGEKDSYALIKAQKDLDSLIAVMPPDNRESLTMAGYHLVDVSTLSLNGLAEDTVLCWFANYGLIKLKFEFEGDTLLNVQALILGYLGNEFPTWG